MKTTTLIELEHINIPAYVCDHLDPVLATIDICDEILRYNQRPLVILSPKYVEFCGTVPPFQCICTTNISLPMLYSLRCRGPVVLVAHFSESVNWYSQLKQSYTSSGDMNIFEFATVMFIEDEES